jgi:hypothetical protein
MPSGELAGEVGHPGQAAADGGGGRTQADDWGGAATVDEAGGAGAAPPLGGAGTRAFAAVQAAAAVLHRRLAAGAAGPGLRSAARRRQVVAGRIAVLEPAAPEGRTASRSPGRGRGGGSIGRAAGGTGRARVVAVARSAVALSVGAPVDDDLADPVIVIAAQLKQRQRALLVAGHEAGGDGGEADGVAADLAAVGVDRGRGVAEELVGHGAEAHRQPVARRQFMAEQGADEVAALGIGDSAGEVEDAGLLGETEGAVEGG